jgi:hypothetical protein
LQIKTNIVSNHAANSKPVKQEVNGAVILLPLEFPGLTLDGVNASPLNSIPCQISFRERVAPMP